MAWLDEPPLRKERIGFGPVVRVSLYGTVDDPEVEVLGGEFVSMSVVEVDSREAAAHS